MDRQSGVAHVNIFWAIVPMVLLLGTGFLAYQKFTESEEAVKAAQKAEDRAQVAETAQKGLVQQLEDLTKVLGNEGEFKPYFGASDAPTRTAFSSPKELLNTLKTSGAEYGLGDSIDRLETVLAAAKKASDDKQTTIDGLRTELESARGEIVKRDQAIQAVKTGYDAEKSRIEQDKVAAEQALDSGTKNKAEELANARRKTEKARDERRTAEEKHGNEMAAIRKEKASLVAANTNLSQKTALINSPEQPDGSILSSSPRIAEAVINLGAIDMVKKGMTFRVLDRENRLRMANKGNSAKDVVKALATIVEVNKTSSRVEIHSLADKYNPVVRDDLIANDLYSKRLKRDICLVGRFVAPYTKGELTKMLESMGNRVHKEWNSSCDLLIVGREQPSTGAEGEEVAKIADSEAYKKAIEHRIEIAPLWKIRDFLSR
jgi:hypothetical protein